MARCTSAPPFPVGASYHASAGACVGSPIAAAATSLRQSSLFGRALQRVSALSSKAGGDKPTKAFHRFVGSAVGALVAETLTLPTDVAKTRMQVLPHYNGFVDCVKRTASEEGVSALWRGLSPALLRQGCYTCLALVIYEPIRDFMTPASRQGGEPTFLERLAAGGTAGAVSITIFNPTEVIKTRMQSSATSTTMAKVFRSVWSKHGVTGFWAGLPPNVARTFLVNAAELGTYDQAKHFFMQYVGDTFAAFMGASAVAGLTSAIISTPVDVAKVCEFALVAGRVCCWCCAGLAWWWWWCLASFSACV